MAYKVIIEPPSEVVTLSEAKNHLQIDDYTVDDSLITDLIQAVREDTEAYLNQKLIQTTVKEYYRGYSIDADYGECMRLSLSPVLSVDEIKYKDETGTTQTLATDKYQIDIENIPCHIYKGIGQTLPSIQKNVVNPLVVTYTVGYGATAMDVPRSIKQAMLLYIRYLYDNRDDPVRALPTASKNLLNKHRIKLY